MSQFKCVHCDLPLSTLCETVDHNIITHPTEELRVNVIEGVVAIMGGRPQISLECFPKSKRIWADLY